MMANPLLTTSRLPHGATPFPEIEASHFVPALEERIREAKTRLAQLKADPNPPNFTNTFAALEHATADVYDVAYVYSNLKAANGDPAMHALAKEIMPKLMALESDINLDAEIFDRVRQAAQTMDPKASIEQKTLAERTFRSFRRNGGLLDEAGKKRLREIDEELSTLGPQFSENVLKDTNAWTLELTDPADLKGLPESATEAALAEGEARGKPKTWVFTLQAPSVMAFLKYSSQRPLREKIWRAYAARALNGTHSNKDLVLKIAGLRHARAKLLGYASHAHFQMEERMAETPDRVGEFLDRLLKKSRPAAEREMKELAAFMRAESGETDLMPWDYGYWANKLKEKTYRLDAEELRPYFRLEAVLDGAFEHARRLYNLSFAPAQDVPVYASDVQVFEVKDQTSGAYMGLLYTDFYPRQTKAGGAWCTRFKSQWQDGRGMHRPHVSIVCNFTKPTPTKPSLLTFQEVSTLFHEFGHALHSLLSRCQHRSLSCTSVFRDFVELPSQIMENWIKEKEGLAVFARHYQSGALIPDEFVKKIADSDNFHAAYQMMRQLRFGFLDLAWYGGDPSGVKDVMAFELDAVKKTDLLPNVEGANLSCSFEHIFSGGYSAGYYGYKWAEVLDADAFEFFKQEGVFSRKVADRFRTAVLERGGTEHPMTLYKEFRGREPDPDALLRRCQLI